MLPYMTDNPSKKVKVINKFYGLNTLSKKAENELCHSENMSGKDFPCLSNAPGEKTVALSDGKINGVGYYNSFFYTSSHKDTGVCSINCNGNSAVISESDAASHRSFAAMSDSILIMPDKVMYKPSDNTVHNITHYQKSDIQSAYELAKRHLVFNNYSITEVATLNSTTLGAIHVSDNTYAMNTFSIEGFSEGEFVFVKFDIYIPYAKRQSNYEQYKKKMQDGFTLQIRKIHKQTLHTSQGEVVFNNYVDFEQDSIDTGGYDNIYITSFSLEKRIPDIDFMCSYGNRIWCTEKNSIRCSLLGDCAVWDDYSSDSYGTLPSSCFAMTVDTGGEFTAICEYNGNIHAFKENCVHKIYGNEPSEFTLHTQSITGVQKGAGNTLVCINGILYYKGGDGFYAYNGGTPQCISEQLENDFEAICAGTDGKDYYVTVEKNGKRQMLVYSPRLKVWHLWDRNAEFFASSAPEGLLWATENEIVLADCSVHSNREWSFDMEFDENVFYSKCYTRLIIEYSLADKGYFTVKTVCDGNHALAHTDGSYVCGENIQSIIVLPRIKCRKITVHFEGRGDFMLKNLTREYFLLKEGGK